MHLKYVFEFILKYFLFAEYSKYTFQNKYQYLNAFEKYFFTRLRQRSNNDGNAIATLR